MCWENNQIAKQEITFVITLSLSLSPSDSAGEVDSMGKGDASQTHGVEAPKVRDELPMP
jgi:hypothetical protein